MAATSRMPANVMGGEWEAAAFGEHERRDQTGQRSKERQQRAHRPGPRPRRAGPQQQEGPASGLASDAVAAAAPARGAAGGHAQQRHRDEGQTQRKRSTADNQIRDHGGGEPEQGQIVPVSGLPAHQVGHADRGRDTRHDAHQRGREQAGQRREEQAVSQQVVTRIPLVVPQDEPEPSEQPDPVLLGRRVRAAQADSEH